YQQKNAVFIRLVAFRKRLVIDKEGKVYYNEGKENVISIGSLNLTDCIVLHNHPKVNGMLSFGENDFYIMREYQLALYRLVNEEYDYSAEIIKSISGLSYNQVYQKGLDIAYETMEIDLQHCCMEYLKREGYINYVRKRIDR
ncbi:MAG: hypothetical protein ACOCM4_08580, partial [Acetivibrio ethanolgignens]